MKVILTYYDADDSEIMATLTLDKGDKVKVDTTYKHLVKDWDTKGIMGKLGKKFYLKDGEEFLKNMPMMYHGSRMRAEIVK